MSCLKPGARRRGGDPYERSREWETWALEAERRGDLKGAARRWDEYARLKEGKGSYFLASYGLYQRSRVLEKEGRVEEAARGYLRAAERVEGELAAFLLLEAARCWRTLGRYGRERRVYETLATRWERRGDFFKAADAYERAAEALRRTGKGWRAYRKPGRAWLRCAEGHMRRGDLGDALWALERAERYFRRIGDRQSLRAVEERRRGLA